MPHRPTTRDLLFAARLRKAERDYVRADDGKFSESPGGGGSKQEKPKPKELTDANRKTLINAGNGKPISPADGPALVDLGLAEPTEDGGYQLTDAGKQAAAEAAKAKGGGGGGGGKEEKPTPQEIANQNRTKVAETVGISPDLDGALARLNAGMGGEADADNAKALADLGLATKGPDGRYTLSAEGKAYYRAAEAGNAETAKTALDRAKQRTTSAKQRQAIKERDARWAAERAKKLLAASALTKRATRATRATAFVAFDVDSLIKDGNEEQIVVGYASAPTIDDQPGVWRGQRYDGDIVEPQALAEALGDYLPWGTVREMHRDGSAAGTVRKAEMQPDGRLKIWVYVADKDAWHKVKTGVYKGFSIGGQLLKAILSKLPDGRVARRISKLLLREISLVDRPANPDAKILMFKGGAMPTALGELADTISKAAAPDPMKATTMLQAMRDELELSGDVEGAQLITNAISLVLQAAGTADAPAEETEVETETDAPEGEDMAMMADAPEDDPETAMAMALRSQLLKAARLRMGKRMPGIESIAKTLLQLAADGGSEWAKKLLGAADAPAAEMVKGLETKTDQGFEILAKGMLALRDQLQQLANQPVAGGPVARTVAITKRLDTPVASVSKPVADPAYVARLRQLIATEVNPQLRSQYLNELAAVSEN